MAPRAKGRPLLVAGRLIDAHPAWSPLGHEIAFSGVTVAGDRRYHLYLLSAQGGRLRRIARDVVSTTPAWSPDGRLLAFAKWDGSVRVMNLAHGKARRLTQLPDAEIRDLEWSPDGRRLAFVAGEVPEED